MVDKIHEVWHDFTFANFIPTLCIKNYGPSYRQGIAFHLSEGLVAKKVPEGYSVVICWDTADGEHGSYSKIEDSVAYSISGNVVTVELSPELLSIKQPLSVGIYIHNADDTCGIRTFRVPVHIEQCYIPHIERSECCDPYIDAYIAEEAEGGSVIEVTVAGIYEGLVSAIFLEYCIKPIEENKSVLIPIEAGKFDLVNGHSYEVQIPVEHDFVCRGVLHYEDKAGNAKVLEGRWELAHCSVCGGIHSWSKC